MAGLRIASSVFKYSRRAPIGAGVGVGCYALILLSGGQLLDDPDSHWHLFVGQQILATGSFPRADAYSHSFAGTPWIAKEWLSQVLMAGAYRLGGWLAVTALMAAATGLALAILARDLLVRLPPLFATALLGFALLCMVPHLLARPHVIALPVMAAWFSMLFRAAERGDSPPWRAVLLMALWANLHGSFTFGLGFGGLVAVEAVARAEPGQRWRVFGAWAAFGLVSLAAACAHPYGLDSIMAAGRVLSLGEAKAVIGEWRPLDFSSFGLSQALLLGGIGAVLLSGLRVSLYHTFLLLLLLHLALTHQRHLTLLGLLAPLVVAPALPRRQGDAATAPGAWGWAIAAGFLGWVGVTGLAVALGHDPKPAPRWMPQAALSAVREAGVTGNVLNDYDFGGYLIARSIPTYIDGRAELYGGRFVAATVEAMELDDLARLHTILDDPRIGWTLLAPSRAAVAYLDRLTGWRRLHADEVAVVHVRVPAVGDRGEGRSRETAR